MSGGSRGTQEEARLHELVAEARAFGVGNIYAKLDETKGYGKSGKLGDLLAELRMACAISRHLGRPVEFQVGNKADMRFGVDGRIVELEVVHRSVVAPWSAVFHPDPATLPEYASSSEPWKRAAHRLHLRLATLPIAIQPWVGASLLAPRATRRDRGEQERACGDVAEWLASELPAGLSAGTSRLQYVDGVTSFDLEPLDGPPGFVKGHGSAEAWIATEGASRASILAKASNATARLRESGAAHYLVGAVIDDALASGGRDTLTMLLGPLVQSELRSRYRPVALARRDRLLDARRGANAPLVTASLLAPEENDLHGFPEGVFLDPATSDASAVVALYYTDALQFVPNPLCSRALEDLVKLFPSELAPFTPR